MMLAVKPRAALPPECPPAQPPDCFNPVAKMAACYELSKDWTAFVEQIVRDVLEEIDPGAFEWPVLGVTDGSLGSPAGFLGELRTTQFSGTWNNIPSLGISFGQQFVMGLPPGCWELSYQLQVFGGQVLTAYCRLDTLMTPPVPTTIPGNLQTYCIATAGSFGGPNPMTVLPLTCPPTPFANTSAVLLGFRVNLYSGIGTEVSSAPYQFNAYARRVR